MAQRQPYLLQKKIVRMSIKELGAENLKWNLQRDFFSVFFTLKGQPFYCSFYNGDNFFLIRKVQHYKDFCGIDEVLTLNLNSYNVKNAIEELL